ncbi:MAG TPA: hypothetical protein PKZ41_04690, partial [Candidatus Omnitrophota bacterium]|nr:hypothetical protein [Candidatus Omnitrophota bacterium]
KLGWALYEYLREKNCLSSDFSVTPRPGFILKRPPEHEIQKVLSDPKTLAKNIPPIFKGYLRLGGLICGDPALDREFGTIDFFILVDVTKVPERYQKRFNYRNSV